MIKSVSSDSPLSGETVFQKKLHSDKTLIKVRVDHRGVTWKIVHEWEHPELAKIGSVKASTLSTPCTTHIYSIDRLKSLLTQTHCKDETALLIKEAFQAVLQSTEESISELSNDQLIDLLEQIEIREPYSETDAKYAHFAEAYQVIEKKYPNLALKNSEISHRLTELFKLGLPITDYTSLVFSDQRLMGKLNILNQKMENEAVPEKRKQIQMVVADLLLACSLVPSRHTSTGKKNACYHETIQPMSKQDAIEELDRIFESHEELFAGNDVVNYQKASYPQRILLLSLLTFSHEVGESIKDDRLFKAIYQRSDIAEWMFAASGSMEQQFLNTCMGAAKQQQFLGHVGTIAGLTMIGKQLLGIIKCEIGNNPLGKDQPFALQQVEKLEKKLMLLEQEIARLSTTETVEPEILKNLSQKWGEIFQQVTLLMTPGAYAEGLKKPIKNGWLQSCLLMFFPVISRYVASQVKGLVGGEKVPSAKFYFWGVYGKEVNRNFEDLTDDRTMPTLAGQFSNDLREDIKNADDRSLWFKNLWYLVFKNGGQALNLGIHGVVIRACRIDGKDVFLLSDPKVDYYQILDAKELEKLLLRQKSFFV